MFLSDCSFSGIFACKYRNFSIITFTPPIFNVNLTINVDFSDQERNSKLVNAFLRSAQKVKFAFAIVKAMRREDLGIIKKREICSVIISTEIKEIFT